MALVDGRQSRFLRREFIKSVLAGAAAGAASGTIWGKAARADSATCAGSRDLALVNGRILTMDPTHPVVSAVAIRDGRFSQIGHAEALGPCSHTINLREARLSPVSSIRTFTTSAVDSTRVTRCGSLRQRLRSRN